MNKNTDDDHMPIDLLLRKDPEDHEIRDKLGPYLRGVRKSKGITMTAAAKAIGMSGHTQLSLNETGKERPSWRTIRALVALYELGSMETITDKFRQSPRATSLTPSQHEMLKLCSILDEAEQQKVEQFILELLQQRFDNARRLVRSNSSPENAS